MNKAFYILMLFLADTFLIHSMDESVRDGRLSPESFAIQEVFEAQRNVSLASTEQIAFLRPAALRDLQNALLDRNNDAIVAANIALDRSEKAYDAYNRASGVYVQKADVLVAINPGKFVCLRSGRAVAKTCGGCVIALEEYVDCKNTERLADEEAQRKQQESQDRAARNAAIARSSSSEGEEAFFAAGQSSAQRDLQRVRRSQAALGGAASSLDSKQTSTQCLLQ